MPAFPLEPLDRWVTLREILRPVTSHLLLGLQLVSAKVIPVTFVQCGHSFSDFSVVSLPLFLQSALITASFRVTLFTVENVEAFYSLKSSLIENDARADLTKRISEASP